MEKKKCPYSFEELFSLLEELHAERRRWQRLVHGEFLDREKCQSIPLDTLYEMYLVFVSEIGEFES